MKEWSFCVETHKLPGKYDPKMVLVELERHESLQLEKINVFAQVMKSIANETFNQCQSNAQSEHIHQAIQKYFSGVKFVEMIKEAEKKLPEYEHLDRIIPA
jgi:N-acetyl-gamma-glutamylphosphate reductase